MSVMRAPVTAGLPPFTWAVQFTLTLAGFALALFLVRVLNQRLSRHCEHIRTRCIHGDEVYRRMGMCGKVYRRACLDCGKRLDLPPLCESHPDVHEWR